MKTIPTSKAVVSLTIIPIRETKIDKKLVAFKVKDQHKKSKMNRLRKALTEAPRTAGERKPLKIQCDSSREPLV